MELRTQLRELFGEIEGQWQKWHTYFICPPEHVKVLVQEILPGQVLIEGEVVDSLPDQELPQIDVRLAPGPEQVPRGPEAAPMWEFLPVLSPHKRSGDYIIDLLPGLDNPEVSIVFWGGELPM